MKRRRSIEGCFFASFARDVFVRERDIRICAGHVLRRHGLSHVARDHRIIPSPAQNRGKNPEECRENHGWPKIQSPFAHRRLTSRHARIP